MIFYYLLAKRSKKSFNLVYSGAQSVCAAVGTPDPTAEITQLVQSQSPDFGSIWVEPANWNPNRRKQAHSLRSHPKSVFRSLPRNSVPVKENNPFLKPPPPSQVDSEALVIMECKIPPQWLPCTKRKKGFRVGLCSLSKYRASKEGGANQFGKEVGETIKEY